MGLVKLSHPKFFFLRKKVTKTFFFFKIIMLLLNFLTGNKTIFHETRVFFTEWREKLQAREADTQQHKIQFAGVCSPCCPM